MDDFKAQGNVAFKEGDFKGAIELYTKGIESDSSNHVLYANRAAALLALQKYEDAKKDSEKCLAIEPNFYKATLRLATALKGLGEEKTALVVLGVGIARAKQAASADGKKAKMSVGEREMRKMERAFKAAMEPPRSGGSGKSTVPHAMVGGKGGAADSEEFRELSERFGKAKHELGRCNAQIQERDQNIKREALCLRQLEELDTAGSDMVTYESVGRMFLRKPAEKIKAAKEDETEKMVNELTDLKKKKEYFQRELQSVQEQIAEVVGKAPRGLP